MAARFRRTFERTMAWLEHFALLRDWAWPVIAPLAVAAAGYLQHERWIWIIALATMAFAFTVVGITVLNLYLERQNPLNKLQFAAAFGCDLTPAPAHTQLQLNRSQRRAQQAQHVEPIMLSPTQVDPSVFRTIDKAQLGIELTNTSSMPLSCFMHSGKTRLEGKQPPRSDYPKPPYVLLPGAKIRMMDEAIEMDECPCGRLAGTVDIVVNYGKSGKETYELRAMFKVDVVMERFGFVNALIADFTTPVT